MSIIPVQLAGGRSMFHSFLGTAAAIGRDDTRQLKRGYRLVVTIDGIWAQRQVPVSAHFDVVAATEDAIFVRRPEDLFKIYRVSGAGTARSQFPPTSSALAEDLPYHCWREMDSKRKPEKERRMTQISTPSAKSARRRTVTLLLVGLFIILGFALVWRHVASHRAHAELHPDGFNRSDSTPARFISVVTHGL